MRLINNLWRTLSFIFSHPLSGGRRLSAIMNFVRWQIGVRLINKKVIVPWVDDARILSGIGEFGLTGNIYCGFMEYEDMLFLLHVLRPEHVFVDVGANVGAYTILASKVVGSKSIAFEPIPETARRLRDQIQINNIESQVDVRNIGVGSKEGELYFTNSNDTVNKVSILGAVENTTCVRVGVLDRELPLEGEYFLKVDVEGFESQVIGGAEKLLESGCVLAMIVELNGRGIEYGHTNAEVHKKIVSYGLVPVAYDPQARSITKLIGFNQNESNTLYIKSLEHVEALVRSAPLRTVHTANSIRL